MTKWIRWPGLIIFLALLLLIGTVFLILIDPVIERIIEQKGTEAVSARVDLESANLSLVPLGLTLLSLQITNPDEPMTNAVEIGEISLSIDHLNLLRRKLIIERMALNGVRFNTPRKTSGALSSGEMRKKEVTTDNTVFEMPSLDMPDVNEILRNEKLQTLDEIEQLRTETARIRQKWNARFKELPDRDSFARYKKKIDNLKGKGGLKGAIGSAGEIGKIRKKVDDSIRMIEGADKEFSEDLAALKNRMSSIKKAPQKDIDRLSAKYSLSPEGIENMGMILFGPKVSSYLSDALSWYGKLEPFMNRSRTASGNTEKVTPLRGRGVDIRFKEEHPLPDFLIRTADVSVQLDAGDITGKISNITPDQHILKETTAFHFSGEDLKGLHSALIKGSLDYMDPEKTEQIITTHIQGYRFRDIMVSEHASLPLSFSDGTADLDGKATVRGEMLNASFHAGLSDLTVASDSRNDTNTISEAISSALAGMSKTDIKADIHGTLDDYRIDVSSDLDSVLKNSVSSELKKRSKDLKQGLTEGIMAKVQGPSEESQSELAGLDSIGSEIRSRLNIGKDVLKGGDKGGFKLPF